MTSEWVTYLPRATGTPPVGFQWDPRVWSVQYRNLQGGKWHLARAAPRWSRTLVYRYRKLPLPGASTSIPEDDALRLEFPMFDGLMAYFPNALAEVSRVSKIGNDQHNPGEPMHWARGKSTDHENKIMRHLVDVGKKDARGVRHAARLAWRSLALLQEELEREEGYPLSRNSTAA